MELIKFKDSTDVLAVTMSQSAAEQARESGGIIEGQGQLRGYKMGGILGTGAFAQVRKAWDQRGRRVAIKIISRVSIHDVSGVEQ